MTVLPFSRKTVFQGSAPLFFASILDEGGNPLLAGQCYRITLDIVREPPFSHEVVLIPYYEEVEIPTSALFIPAETDSCKINFRHRIEVYDENDVPQSAFVYSGNHYKIEYSFYWRDVEGRDKLPVKFCEYVRVI